MASSIFGDQCGVLRTNLRAILIPLRVKSVTRTLSFTQLRLQQVILVAHDASGPPAIDWALGQPERVAGLVLLNTYYCAMPALRPPEAIWLFSAPLVRNIARPVSRLFGHWIFRRMYQWQVGRFFRDAEVQR